MHFSLPLIFIFSILTFNSCGIDVEDPTSPSPPQWIPKSLPEEWPERGIDAHESGGIILEWVENRVEDNIIYYSIFRSHYYAEKDSLADFSLLVQLDVVSQFVPEYIDHTAQTYIKYFYKINAGDASGNYSSFSDSITYSLYPSVNYVSMQPNGLSVETPSDRTLSWTYSYAVEMEDYLITILDNDNSLIIRAIFTPSNYIGAKETWVLPNEILLEQGLIYHWRVDMGANYRDDVETAGSESPWASFVYQ